MDDSPSEFPPVDYRQKPVLALQRRRRWRSPLLIVLVILIGIAAIVWYETRGSGTGGAAGGGHGRLGANLPQPVAVAAVQRGDMPLTFAGLGTVTPIATVTVQSQISGQIMQIAFKEGQNVRPGDFLIQIDPRPYQVALEQAEGTLAHDKALLDDARLDLARYQTLLKQDSIAAQQVDTQRALVHQYEGSVTADQGAIDNAKLDLTYCHIVSPIGGRVGLQQVNLGNYITPAEPNGLVIITQLHPITVVFTLAEDDIPDIQKRLRGGAVLPVTVRDRANKTVLGTGTLETIDNQIDTTTGTVKFKAIFDNPDETLFPNQFVNTELLLDTVHDAILAPQAAIQNGAPGAYVYLLQPDDTVKVQPVTLGASDAANVVIAKGLKAGDQVVIDGADRLKDGAHVTVPAATAKNAGAKPGGTAPPATEPQTDEPDGTAAPNGQHRHHRRPPGAPAGDSGETPPGTTPAQGGAQQSSPRQPAPQP